MPQHPNVCTDGSREDFSSIGGFQVAGAGVHFPASELAFDGSIWRAAEEYGDARLERFRAFMSVPGVMQTVQRAEFWGAVVALQAYWPCHLGIDNLNVARSIRRLDHDRLVKPLPLVKGGDLIALARYMIRTCDRETVRVTKVKGHAEDVDVQQGRVRLVDQQGNAEADAAADSGRRHHSEVLIDARRRLLTARCHWYPIMLDLHRFMIAVARVSVNHDGKGGHAPDPLVWDQGSRPKVRKLAIRVNVDLASLPGPPGFLSSSWVQGNSSDGFGSLVLREVLERKKESARKAFVFESNSCPAAVAPKRRSGFSRDFQAGEALRASMVPAFGEAVRAPTVPAFPSGADVAAGENVGLYVMPDEAVSAPVVACVVGSANAFDVLEVPEFVASAVSRVGPANVSEDLETHVFDLGKHGAGAETAVPAHASAGESIGIIDSFHSAESSDVALSASGCVASVCARRSAAALASLAPAARVSSPAVFAVGSHARFTPMHDARNSCSHTVSESVWVGTREFLIRRDCR